MGTMSLWGITGGGRAGMHSGAFCLAHMVLHERGREARPGGQGQAVVKEVAQWQCSAWMICTHAHMPQTAAQQTLHPHPCLPSLMATHEEEGLSLPGKKQSQWAR